MFRKALLIGTTLGVVTAFAFVLVQAVKHQRYNNNPGLKQSFTVVTETPANEETTPKKPLPPVSIPQAKTLPTNYHVFQTFNNCGPAALSMTLSHFGINVSQQILGQQLRPYQNPFGNNDDKSVTLPEIARKGEEYGFVAFHRPNGTAELVKQFIALDIPVITRTWLKLDEDIGHFRVIKGYDDKTQEFIQDDSLQGKNLHYTYSTFNDLWEIFNYEYLVLVPKEKLEEAERILGTNYEEQSSWNLAVENASKVLQTEPNNSFARFNLSVAYYHIGKYQESVTEYEKVQDRLSWRTLWYQIEPILSYYELGEFNKVFNITNSIVNNHNRAYSELYIIRGNIYLKQNKVELAIQEFEKAVFYNKSLKEAQEALAKARAL